MKHPRPLYFLLLLSFMRPAQAADLSPAELAPLTARAASAIEATRQGDARTIVQLTHPALTNAVGGTQRMENMFRDAMALMKAQGFEMTAVEMSPPVCPPPVETHRFCLVPTVTTIAADGRTGKSHTFLMAVRDAETANDWVFLDGAAERRNPGALRKLLPWLPADVPYPPNFNEPLQ